ncbi:MAG: hypothetical protein INR73_15005 [Williamsia sp.]|nr:hypothetical protein [Williamsia sp.]
MTGQTVKGLYGAETYVIGRELGKGGEGAVYEISNHPSQVIKLYNELPEAEKVNKLRYMVSLAGTAIQNYAAWPTDLVTDKWGVPVGFVMKKLVNAIPLHKLFSPVDRKRLFPDRGYNFLVHVSRNLALAFHNLHAAGVVAGDVNEGNVLVDGRGMISLIDCDSFQIQDGQQTYFCEVGVPRYTPPELLERRSFEKVVRTPDTDSFSLSVLIFQLLFLGRHPFAGKNTTREDIDEETAIRNHYFAFSRRSRSKKLHPPPDSLDLGSLPDPIIHFFHQSFENRYNRPKPEAWIRELDAFIREMVTCSQTKLHTYPGKLPRCPWCEFRQKKGILYFLDESYVQSSYLLQDVESFVNGFKVDKIHLPARKASYVNPVLLPTPVPKKFYRHKRWRWIIKALIVVGWLPIVCNSPALGFAIIVSCKAISAIIPWNRKIDKELARRNAAHKQLVSRYESLLDEYNHPNELTAYEREVTGLNELISRFRSLPDELQKRRHIAEEKLIHEQLRLFLQQFSIQNHTISAFGTAKKAHLFLHGIHTAADITALHHTKILGIGPKNIQILFSWQQQMATQFVYRPDPQLVDRAVAGAAAEVAGLKSQLETEIRKQYQALHYLRVNIDNKRTVLNRQLDELGNVVYQAELDLEAFKAFSN